MAGKTDRGVKPARHGRGPLSVRPVRGRRSDRWMLFLTFQTRSETMNNNRGWFRRRGWAGATAILGVGRDGPGTGRGRKSSTSRTGDWWRPSSSPTRPTPCRAASPRPSLSAGPSIRLIWRPPFGTGTEAANRPNLFGRSV